MYYIRFNNDDGSSDELEVHQGHIFCKCHICGQEFAPSHIEFDRQFHSEEEFKFWNCCSDCFAKYDAIESKKRANAALSQYLSRVFKKEITPADAQQFLDDSKDTEDDCLITIQKYFDSYPPTKKEANYKK